MMSDGRHYSETLRMQRSTGTALAVWFGIAFAPLVMLAWYYAGLAMALLAVAAYGLALGAFQLARWTFEVRDDGLYYRVIPFYPVWRKLAAAEAVIGVEPGEDNAADFVGRSGLFRGPDGERVIGSDFDGCVRIARADDPDVVLSSSAPDKLAAALRDVSGTAVTEDLEEPTEA